MSIEALLGFKLTRHVQIFTSSGTFTPSAAHLALGGIVNVDYLVGAGAGAGGVDASGGASGGGSGGQVLKDVLVIVAGATTVTIGAHGTGGTTAGTAGTVGGDTTFGSLLSALGGGSGDGMSGGSVTLGTARWGIGGQGNPAAPNSGCGAGNKYSGYSQRSNAATNPDSKMGGFLGGGAAALAWMPAPGIDIYGIGGYGVGANMTVPVSAITPNANSGNGGNAVGGSGSAPRAGSNGADGYCQISWWE